MPPKSQAGASKKAEAKAKQKIIEDKTFGLKNKNKSAKVNKYIQQVESQVKQAGRRKGGAEAEAEARATALREKKKLEEQKKAELAALFKPVVQPQKVPPGVDPKTVICQYFKSGQCAKGDKCKFSHDLTIERKSAKINLYEDRRDESGEGDENGANHQNPEDTMKDWDQNKLEQVVQRKHNKGVKTTTDIVCKYFLDAIEKKNYGWFWECPNGGDSCKYRHALPPGFVLKNAAAAKKRDASDEGETISLEEFLEIERYRIEKRTPVTAETFLKWKADRRARAEAEERAREREKEAQIKAGKMLHVSGRDLFMYNPDLYLGGDDEEAMDMDYTRREEEASDGETKQELEGLDEDAFLEEDFDNIQIDDEEEEENEDDDGKNAEEEDDDDEEADCSN